MHALTALVAALIVAVALNYLLTFAIVRRLRLQLPKPRQLDLPAIGVQAPNFRVEDSMGRVVDELFYSVSRDVVLAFFDEGCGPCEVAKQALVRKPLRDPFLAFVRNDGQGSDASDIAKALDSVGATVVLFNAKDNLTETFGVLGFPTFLRLRDGVVEVASHRLDDIRTSGGTRQPSVTGLDRAPVVSTAD
jgi:thiol-disulfide isomerase/thioredoxin